MKLAFCIFKYFPYGGLQRDLLQTAQQCSARGHEVHIFTQAWQGEKPMGCVLHEVSTHAFTNHGRAKQFVRRVLPQLKTFDCVIGFNRMPGLDVYFAGDVCFAAQRKNQTRLRQLLPRTRVYAAFEQAVYGAKAHPHILLLTPAEKRVIQQHYHTPDNRFTILPLSIESTLDVRDIKKRESIRAQRHIAKDETILLMVGSDFYRKGVDRAIVAVNNLPYPLKDKVHLWVVGQGKKRGLPHSERVTFLGTRDDVADLMQAADILLHPARTETAGLVLMEAMTAQLPILVTAVCGYAPYIAEAKAGVLIPEPFSQQNFNEALQQLLQSDLNVYRIAAKRYVQMYPSGQRFARIMDVIETSRRLPC